MDPALLTSYADKWGIGEEARQKLQGFSPDYRRIFFNEFDPKPDRDVNAQFFQKYKNVNARYAYSEYDGAPSEEEMRNFQAHHGIDDKAIGVVREFDPKVQKQILTKFSPPTNCTNINAVLVTFASGVSKSFKDNEWRFEEKKSSSGGSGGWVDDMWGEFLDYMGKGGGGGGKGGGGAGGKGKSGGKGKGGKDWGKSSGSIRTSGNSTGWASNVTTTEFDNVMDPALAISYADKWGLGQEAREKLNGFSPEYRKVFFTEFDPKPDRDVNAQFFQKYKNVNARMTYADYEDVPTEDEMKNFQWKWGVDDRAIGVVRDFHPKVQRQILNKFIPPARATNINAVLVKFAAGVADSFKKNEHKFDKKDSGGDGGGDWMKDMFTAFLGFTAFVKGGKGGSKGGDKGWGKDSGGGWGGESEKGWGKGADKGWGKDSGDKGWGKDNGWGGKGEKGKAGWAPY
eukprot:gnl/MRDRNA2_/MRDRNA2_62214_c0_seq1.p1 gnl/MRDRNA2_/MRDRNA2_62214_c0~~gnl/MRDRNA2_/MRDRNA2_62214_c0_seq1.p1  ORF type:complete len:455 (+),score=102.84 gnl/MRDRNA2_/MRDRNA2_62214_c0_seq1:67-1431(+)